MTISNLKLSLNGDKNQMTNKLVTFETVMERIKHMGLETNITVALINKARTIPPGSLEHFINNIQTYVANLTRETHVHKNQQT